MLNSKFLANLMSMPRRYVAAALLLAALIAIAVVLLPVVQTIPASVHAAEHGGTVDLSVDDTTVLTSADCVTARWHVEQIKSVEIDGHGVVGEGTRASCASTVELRVGFQDGSQQTYTIAKQVRTASLLMRGLIVTAIFAVGLALIVSGLPAALGRWVGAKLPSISTVQAEPRLQIGVLLAAAAIVLIGAAVRTHYLSRSLRYDESWTYIDFASQSPATIVSNYDVPNNHIFHSLLVHFSTGAFGVYPWTLRLPAYFAGLLMIAATFAVGRRFYGARVGLLASALVAGASWLVEYSTNGRGYTLVAADFLLLLLLASDLRRRRSPRRWLAFALLGALGLYTIPIMAYPLGLVCVWLGLSILIEKRGRQQWLWLREMALSLLLTGLLTALLYLPAYIFLRTTDTFVSLVNLEQVTWADFTEAFAGSIAEIAGVWQRDLAPVVVALLIVGFVAAILFHRRLARDRVSLLAAALLWLPAVVFLQLVTTYARLWLFLQPLVLILAAAGLLYLGRLVVPARWWPRVGAFAGAAVLAAAVSAGGVIRSNSVDLSESERALGAEAAMRAVAADAPADALVLCAHKCPVFQFYGVMYGVPAYPNFRDKLKRLKPGTLYVVDSLFDAEIDVKKDMELMNISPDQFGPPMLLMSEGDTQAFRLDRVGE